MFGFGTYTYVFVCLRPGAQSYAYRTNDPSIKAGDMVVVPAGNEEKVGSVTEVRKYKKAEAPFPLEKTKLVIRKATPEDMDKNPAFDLRIPMDISTTSIRTETGYKIIVLGQRDRDALRKQLAGRMNIRIIETYPVSMAGQIVKEKKT